MELNVFPFTLYCGANGGGDHTFRNTFMAHRPKDVTWYGYDVVVNSPTSVTFVVYNMHDNYRGGLGKEILRFDVNVPVEVTLPRIGERAMFLAAAKRQEELDEAEEKIVQRYAQDILTAAMLLYQTPDEAFSKC